MSKQTDSSLFISSPLAKYAGLYQGLLRGIGSFQQLGTRIVKLGERAHAFRQFDLVQEVGQTLSHLPIKDCQSIGHYFLAVAFNNCGKGDQEEARKLFERVIDTVPSTYKARAIHSLAGVSARTGNLDGELYCLTEALKASKDIATTLNTQKGIAVHKAKEGYHKHSLRDLENLAPLAKYLAPYTYFDYLNSYAVELGTVGRLTEACSVIKVVTASPFAPFYPEWQETLSDLRKKHKPRSTVSIPRKSEPQKAKPVSDNVLNAARVETVTDFMKANLHRPFELAELAGTVNLSESYFPHIFKTETGVSPVEYSIRLRMEEASRLLTTTYRSIKQVIAEVGYNNKGNFGRSFKLRFQVSPSQYRRQALARKRRKNK